MRFLLIVALDQNDDNVLDLALYLLQMHGDDDVDDEDESNLKD
jgi:hypothetical protein